MRFKHPPLSFQNPPPIRALFTNLLMSMVVIDVLVVPLTFQILDLPNIEPEPVDETLPVHFVLFV